jgi:tetratricopeptide (TPR) repeat protein
LTLHIELVDVNTETALWSGDYNRSMTNLVLLQNDIARDVSQKLQARLSSANEQRVTKTYTANAEAYQLYLQGRFYWNKRTEEGITKAITYFNQAIEKDPNYALAYAGLANCYITLDSYFLLPPKEAIPKAKVAAMKALEIDDNLAEAHTASATYYYDWDWSASERQFRRAIELNPNYATAHQWYAELLVYEGRFDEAIAEIKRAQELDPLSLIINTVMGRIYWQTRQYDQGIEQLRKTIEMDPNFAPAHRHLGVVYELKGMYPEAIAEIQRAVTLSGNGREYIAILGQAYAVAGKRAEALKIIEGLKEESKRHYVPAYGIAVTYARLGEKDLAFEWFEKAYEEHDYGLVSMKIQPTLDSLHSDPRFADLVRRLGL